MMTSAAITIDGVMRSSRSLLVRNACSMVGPADAEDVVQEAFECALRARTLRYGSNPRPSIARIARNVAIDALQKRLRSGAIAEPRPDVESAESAALRAEAVSEITIALDRLSPAQRRAVVLHDLEGYSTGEIAATDGISIHTVRTRLFRARRRLRCTIEYAQT